MTHAEEERGCTCAQDYAARKTEGWRKTKIIYAFHGFVKCSCIHTVARSAQSLMGVLLQEWLVICDRGSDPCSRGRVGAQYF